jgi:hypothetical protein
VIQLPKDPRKKEEVLRTLLSLKNQSPWVYDWLRENLARIDTLNATERDDVIFRQRQGARQGLDDIIKAMENSKDALTRAKEQR